MALTELQKQELRTWCISASDDALRNILNNKSSHNNPDSIAIVTEIWESRGYKLPDNIPEPQRGNEVGVKNMDTGTASYFLTTLCARWFCLMFEIGLWLSIIGGTITGAVIGYSSAGETGALLGLIIGCIISFVVTLFAGGLISVFLKLCADVTEIKRKLKN